MMLTDQARFCPKCGSSELKSSDRKLLHCDACGFHFYLNTGAAVAGYILDDAGNLLLVERARDPGKGMLAPPGGFIDFGETAEEAVIRETREETGLQVVVGEYLGAFPNLYAYRGIDYPTLDFFYLCRVPHFADASAREEVAAVVMLPWKRVDRDRIAFESMRLAYDRLEVVLG